MELPKSLAMQSLKLRYCTRKRIAFIPIAVDGASSHIGKLAQIVKCGKEGSGLIQKHWSPTEFEELADSSDKDDNDKLQKYRKLGRSYMLSASIDGKIRFLFIMSPLMTKVATESDFLYNAILHTMNVKSMLNKNTWGVKKCGANQKQHCKQAGVTKKFDIS